MSELSVGTLSGLAANGYVIDVASGSQLTQPGMIVQVVRATDTIQRTTTSTSYADVAGMTVTITPKKSTSTILVIAAFGAQFVSGSEGNRIATFQLTDSSDIAISGAEQSTLAGLNIQNMYVPATLIGYSTPGTTSATTYKMRFKVLEGTTVNVRNDNMTGQMYAIEVAA